MRFVEVKSPEQQSVMVLHKVRQILIQQRTQLSNAIRGHMAEFGLVGPIGRENLAELVKIVEAADERLPDEARVNARQYARRCAGVGWPWHMSTR